MTDRITSVVNFLRANGRRALTYVLLFLIAYGSTVEAVHSHGRVSTDRPGVAAVYDASGSHSSRTGNSQLTECQLCQFQQHLFNGLVHAPLFARTPLAAVAFVPTLTVLYPSTSATPPSGRGPPLA